MALLCRQPLRVVATRAGTRQLVQVRQAVPALPGWRTYAVTALGPRRDDEPLHDGPLAA